MNREHNAVPPDREHLDARISGARAEIALLERSQTRRAGGNHRLATLQAELAALEAQLAALEP
jgi:hypothetical protein